MDTEVDVFPEESTELVHAVISDRFTGVNQFGLEGNLNLQHDDYGVKTGTSRDFHDSWVVGYTEDFVVGVWLGNSENEPMDQVSGSSGAGATWHDVMEYLLTTEYNQGTGLELANIERVFINGNDEWSLKRDVVSEHQDLLSEDNLILSLHDGDVFELVKDLTIPLRARKIVEWNVDSEYIESAQEVSFIPDEIGVYEISAFDEDAQTREIITVEVTQME